MHENIPISTSPPVGNDSRSSLMESIRNSGIGVLKKLPLLKEILLTLQHKTQMIWHHYLPLL